MTIEETLHKAGIGHRHTPTTKTTGKHQLYCLHTGRVIGEYRALEACYVAERILADSDASMFAKGLDL